MREVWSKVRRGVRRILSHDKVEQIRRAGRSGLTRTIVFVRQHKLKAMLIATAVPALFIALLLAIAFYDSPGRATLSRYQNPVPSEVYTADGVLIGRYFIRDRKPVKYEQLSRPLIEAVVATEDIRFFRHRGIDAKSLVRVLVKTILFQNESSGGGSTLTQQLAKNISPRREYVMLSMLINKLREAIIAARLESIYTKKEILTLYLNTVPFADNRYGIGSAAYHFFSRSASELSPDQAALLVGMLKATHTYNPRLFPGPAKERRNVVLSQMKKYHFLPANQCDSLQALPLGLSFGSEKREYTLAAYFREYVKTELEQWCKHQRKADGSAYDLFLDGLKVYTTLDSKLQTYAEAAVHRQMSELQEQFLQHMGSDRPWQDNPAILMDAFRRTTRYKALQQRGLSEAEIVRELQKPIKTQLFTWRGVKSSKTNPLDSIRHHLQFLNAGFLVMEPASGEIKAWVGGIDHRFFPFDHVKGTTRRQVGSIFKPVVYALALEQGISPCELIPADQETYIDEEGQPWTPRNSQYDYPMQYSLRGALAYSVNTVAVKLINRVGIANTIALARKMGIESEMPSVPSIALGSSAISLMEMTSAYACIANEGLAVPPRFISRIEDRDGNAIGDFSNDARRQRALTNESALLVRHMLQTVVQEGTASRLRWRYGIYNDVAGKTGTTQSNADGWFMAMTPGLVMGTWVGADDPRIRFRDTEIGQGANTALPITAYFLKMVNEDPHYRTLAKAKFKNLPSDLRQHLNCDLYEFNDDLWSKVEKTVQARDSLMMLDSLNTLPPETFLQTLYHRKRKIAVLAQEREQRVVN